MHVDKSDTEMWGAEEAIAEARTRSLDRDGIRWREYVQRELRQLRKNEPMYTAETGGELIRWKWHKDEAVPQLVTTLDVVWKARPDGSRERVEPTASGWYQEGAERWLREYWNH